MRFEQFKNQTTKSTIILQVHYFIKQNAVFIGTTKVCRIQK